MSLSRSNQYYVNNAYYRKGMMYLVRTHLYATNLSDEFEPNYIYASFNLVRKQVLSIDSIN